MLIKLGKKTPYSPLETLFIVSLYSLYILSCMCSLIGKRASPGEHTLKSPAISGLIFSARALDPSFLLHSIDAAPRAVLSI